MEGLTTGQYVRKPFEITAVRVTADNIETVAKWCEGEIRNREGAKIRYIHVDVPKPLNERQTMAYIGDWVMTMGPGSGYKVYTNVAFQSSFDPKNIENAQLILGRDVFRLLIELDVVRPELVLKKGDETRVFDTEKLFLTRASIFELDD